MIRRVCEVWDSAVLTEPVPEPVICRTAISLDRADENPRFAYVSVGSPIEQLLSQRSRILDITEDVLPMHDLTERLLDGEVAGVLAQRGATAPSTTAPALPDQFLLRRQALRRNNVLVRFLIRQIGLEEVSAHRGAPAVLYEDVAAMWSTGLALCTDPAMLLTLGADRQRYVDSNYNERATDRLPRALGRLHDLGVRSYPRLVIV